jgi:hypothetical protein
MCRKPVLFSPELPIMPVSVVTTAQLIILPKSHRPIAQPVTQNIEAESIFLP